MNIYKKIYPLITKFDPEDSHDLAIKFLKFLPRFSSIFCKVNEYENLRQNLFNLSFNNPIGMAAGFDKNALLIDEFAELGFGFIEIGTVTPKPQVGNPKPRLFRIPEQQAIINRLGFNNKGVDVLVKNVQNTNYRGILGINIGKNADTPIEHAAQDYLICMRKVYPHASYITVNISSPNTRNLRQLQGTTELNTLILVTDINNIE